MSAEEDKMKDLVEEMNKYVSYSIATNPLIKNFKDANFITSETDLASKISELSNKSVRIALNVPADVREVIVLTSLIEAQVCNFYLSEAIRKMVKNKEEMEKILVDAGIAFYKNESLIDPENPSPLKKPTLH